MTVMHTARWVPAHHRHTTTTVRHHHQHLRTATTARGCSPPITMDTARMTDMTGMTDMAAIDTIDDCVLKL